MVFTSAVLAVHLVTGLRDGIVFNFAVESTMGLLLVEKAAFSTLLSNESGNAVEDQLELLRPLYVSREADKEVSV